jgi:hypothetical protein
LLCISAALNLFANERPLLVRTMGWNDELDPIRWHMVSQIPRDGTVVSSFDFLAELSQRKNLYSLHNIWQGFNVFSSINPYTKNSSEHSFALVDWKDPWLLGELENAQNTTARREILQRLNNFYKEHPWWVMEAANEVTLLTNNPEFKNTLVSVNSSVKTNDALNVTIDNTFTLKDFKINAIAQSRLPMSFTWKAIHQPEDIYNATFEILRDDKIVYKKNHALGYAVYSTLLWKAGETINENYWLYLPNLSPGSYNLRVSFYKLFSDADIGISYNNVLGNTFNLGTLTIHERNYREN